MDMFGKTTLKALAAADSKNYNKNHGIRWGFTLFLGDKIGTWDAKISCEVSRIIDQKYALSYLDFQAFYQFYNHLKADSNMEKLWHEFFDDQPRATH